MDGLGEHSAAEDTFTQALAVWEEINQDSGRFRALAGLSRLALKDGQTADLRRALDRLEPIISDIEKGGVAEAEMLFEVILTCWQMLEANRDPRAGKILERAYELLKVRAARISDPELRRSYLENNPVNRQLMEARLET
jgi:hypothetical protein